MEENALGYKLNKAQLRRIDEIFRGFFNELEETLISHLVYRVSFTKSINPQHGTFVRMLFTMSNEEGVQQEVWAVYNIDKDSLEWGSKKLVFEKSRLGKLKEAFKKVVHDIDTIELSMSMLIVEAGTKWVFGTIVQDMKSNLKNRDKVDDYILFLKSNLYFDDYALKKDGNSVFIDDELMED